MGNKDSGRKINKLDNVSYMKAMGASDTTSAEAKNTGYGFSNNVINMYFNQLKNYALNRIKWSCEQIPDSELRLIEWFIFEYGYCAMLKPKITKNNIEFTPNCLKIFPCTFTKINNRNGEPEQISLSNLTNTPINISYDAKEFVIFHDNFLFAQQGVPFNVMTYAYANKLYELDLSFNANSHRSRMPFVFNNGSVVNETENKLANITHKGLGISEVIRSAFARNEQFVEISQNMVGDRGFMFEPQFYNNEMLNYLQAQKDIYDSYFHLLGLYTNKEKQGAYTVKNIQEEGDESGDFRTECLINTRKMCAQKASNLFGISLKIEVL